MATENRWAIYYADGTVFSNRDGTWEQAPTHGVLFILQRYPGKDVIRTISGNDYYVMVDDTVADTMDLSAQRESFRKKYPDTAEQELAKATKHGLYVSISTFERVATRVAQDAKKMAAE